MERSAVPESTPASGGFRDGLGERRHVADPAGNQTLEQLCLRNELAAVPSFEFALRERVSRLAGFRHPQFGRARGVERLIDRESTLAVVSEHTAGVRLSDLIAGADQRRLGLDITAALRLIRQLVPAVAALHESARDVAHGAIGPERLVVTPDAQLVVVEYVLGAALEQLRFARERYWSELRIALPHSASMPRFDQRADVTQLGVVALSLILGRRMRDDEYPARIADVVASTWAVSPGGGFEPLPPGLRGWLGRALQLDARTAFPSAIEARIELDKVLGDGQYGASPESCLALLARYHGAEQPVPIQRPATRSPLTLRSPARPVAAVTLQGRAGEAPMMPPRGTPVKLRGGAGEAPMTPTRRTPVTLRDGAGEAPMTPPRGTPVMLLGDAAEAPMTPPQGTPVMLHGDAAEVPMTPPRGVPVMLHGDAAEAPMTPPRGTPATLRGGAGEASITPPWGTPMLVHGGAAEAQLPPPRGTVPSTPATWRLPPGPATLASGTATTLPRDTAMMPTPPRGTAIPPSALDAPTPWPFTPAPASPPTPVHPVPAPFPTVSAPSAMQFQGLSDSLIITTPPTRTPPRGIPRPPRPRPAVFELPPVVDDVPDPDDDTGDEKSSPDWAKISAVAAVLMALLAGGAFAGRRFLVAAPAAAITTGTLVITTNPTGVQAIVDNQSRGETPLTIVLHAGAHKLELRGADGAKIVPVTITAGMQVTQYIEIPHPVSVPGQLQIRTEPAGGRVSVDGVARGTSPMTVADLPPGEHTVVFESDLGSTKQTVTIESGVTASLVVPMSAAALSQSGWIAVSAPVEMQLFEGERLLGTTRSDRMVLPAGRHDIDIVSDELGYRVTRTVRVASGKVAAINVEMPRGTIALNALPWAEVWIDGEKIGDTPIGNFSLAIGPHDVVFRNPDLGEEHHTTIVTLKEVDRLSVDLRKP